MKDRRSRRWALITWALIGAAVLVLVLIALFAGGSGSGDAAHPTPVRSASPSTASPTSTARGSDVVDPGVAKRAWVPEPITQNADVYARAALEATATFDTRRSTRGEWVKWLETWFTPSPLYKNQQDAVDQMAGYKAELGQSVVLPQAQWDDLASGNGHVTARVDGDLKFLDLPEAAQKHVRTATANVVMTFTRTGDGTGGQVTYDQTVRVSVQVVCGGASVPTPNSPQHAGDCKVVRFFDAAVG